MNLNELKQQLLDNPQTVQFNDVIAVIEDNYNFTPSSFDNGTLHNEAGQNNGSCKIFAFAKMNELTQDQTLNCFGDYYRQDVLEHPEASDHQNIRNFMLSSWDGVVFHSQPLVPK